MIEWEDFVLKQENAKELKIDDFKEPTKRDYIYFYCAIRVGGVCNKEEIEQYVSISRVDKGWIYYDGTTVKKCSFKDLLNHKHLKMLFYSTNNK